jgi:formamidopyrimidine-DNA glycosylase
MSGRVIQSVEFVDSRFTRPVPNVAMEDLVSGQRLGAVRRRGKYIIWLFDSGDAALIHLRMTGSFSADDWTGASVQRSHVRAVFHLDDGSVIRYHDPRRFGTFAFGSEDSLYAFLDDRLGPEPLENDFDAGLLRRQLRGRSAPIKAALLDQRVVAGLGNIYVDESLHLAGISPLVPGGSLSVARSQRLVGAIVCRLTEAIEAGGSTLRDYRGVEGADGTMQERFLVYGRAALPCTKCGTSLRSATIGGRTTVWCGRCQR